MFQYPTSGFSLFYIHLSRRKRTARQSFNTLLRAFLFSTVPPDLGRQTLGVFQCPTSGFSLFYDNRLEYKRKRVMFVSMPYFGLFSFLHYRVTHVQLVYNNVSMPYFGLFSFLLPTTYTLNHSMMFQCPTSGFSLFYFLSYAVYQLKM